MLSVPARPSCPRIRVSHSTMAEFVLGEILWQHLASLALLAARCCYPLLLVVALPHLFGPWEVSAVVFLGSVEVEDAGWH